MLFDIPVYSPVYYLIWFCTLSLFEISEGSKNTYKNEFGEGYGKKWVLIADNREALHYVNFTNEPVPSTRASVGEVNFRLYTRRNINKFEDLSLFSETNNNVPNINIYSEYFNSRLPIKIITHGWMSNGASDTVLHIKDSYLNKYDLNIIAVDWGDIAGTYLYPRAADSISRIGEYVANFMNNLAHYGVRGSQIHLIGHSLGAHVMGVAAARSKERISRVTGLDPAAPLFEWPLVNDSRRLDKTDAEFVDAIHTCAGVLGFSAPLGHVDFYPNGGFPGQPGCAGFQAIIESCSHGRSHQYFAESINSSSGYKAYRCDSWKQFTQGKCSTQQETVLMGDALHTNTTGTYYLYTKAPQKI